MRPPGPDVSGKIAEAWWLTSRFSEAIEADLQRYYGLDFVDLFVPGSGLTWRKLLVLVHHLPPESAVNTAIRNATPEDVMAAQGAKYDPKRANWSSLESLIALLIDEVRNNTWVYAQSMSKSKIARPSPIPRPGVSGRRRRTISLASAQRLDPRLRGLEEAEAQAMLDRIKGKG